MEFATGGLAAVCAGFFTNPLEVVKTRLQLQGELRARGMYAVHYRGFFHAFSAVARADGLLALQKGLVPGLWYQLALNGTRLGLYQAADDRGWTRDPAGHVSLLKAGTVAAVTGCAGGYVGSPFYLVKTHLQAQAADSVAVGHQHGHSGMTQGLRHVYQQHGVAGLWRGVLGAMPRSAVGSFSQLVSFAYCKQWLSRYQVFQENPLLNSFASSMTSGVSISLCMTPADVIMTRLYNQGVDANGKGLLYKGVWDCAVKIWRSEGIYGFYKGLVPSYVRLGPHTVLCFVFWDFFKDLERKTFHEEAAAGKQVQNLRSDDG
ncbi:solute carrier family 25 member 35-like isoform X3 [Bacillus rossius redtenbacheri]|uniref:solute carrier family 25 member 35-like isoform X3 n=1 Tax=Bacillus rossius redtenbacheri TaxID=93214 RepID=UPI002FDDC17D